MSLVRGPGPGLAVRLLLLTVKQCRWQINMAPKSAKKADSLGPPYIFDVLKQVHSDTTAAAVGVRSLALSSARSSEVFSCLRCRVASRALCFCLGVAPSSLCGGGGGCAVSLCCFHLGTPRAAPRALCLPHLEVSRSGSWAHDHLDTPRHRLAGLSAAGRWRSRPYGVVHLSDLLGHFHHPSL